MFTGIVEEKGMIRQIRRSGLSAGLVIGARKVPEGMHLGDSVAVNGICLTVTDFGSDFFRVDVMPETIRQTSLASLKEGSLVNLERALRLSDRLGGHLVSGHIDGTGHITAVRKEANAVWITLKAAGEILRYIIPRGSVALDGVSLTVTHTDATTFRVSIIPHTQSETILTDKRPGDPVNIECDMIAKYVERFTLPGKSGGAIDADFLKKYDFYE